MPTLGIDPGPRHNAWAHLDGRRLLDRGTVSGPDIATSKHPKAGVAWKRALANILEQLSLKLEEKQPSCVGIETVQHAISDTTRTDAQRQSQAINTQRTGEIIAGVQVLCAKRGLPCYLVHPVSSLAALGLRQGVTDRQVSERAGLLFGVKGWAVGDAHQARAAGVGLRAESDWRRDKAAKKQGVLAV